MGSGFLGSYILKNAKSYYKNEKIIGTYRASNRIPSLQEVEFHKCDVTSKEDLLKLRARCLDNNITVFYLAACHNIDYVFNNRDEAARINIDALKSFYDFMPKIDKLFFASTDCVYGESGELSKKFSEKDEPNPINAYGKQKAEAEKIVLAHNHCAVRLPFMFGPSLSNQQSFYDSVCQKLKNKEPVEMIDGMQRNAVSFSLASKLLLRLSCLEKSTIPSIVNLCSDYTYKKYDIGIKIAEEIGADSKLIKKISEQDGKKFFTDKRASSIVMDNRLIKETLCLESII